MLINMDLKQIEVVVLAVLSDDPMLLKVVETSDIYRYFATIMFDKKEDDITKAERDDLKEPVLGMSYGRSAKALSESSGKSITWCENFIETFYTEFPKVKELHNKWIAEVERTGRLKLFNDITFKFNKYLWNKVKKEKEISTAYHARYWTPEIKNYPIQHTAYCILSTFIAVFFREKAVYNRDKYLLISTVHDSLVIDCKPEYVEDCIKDLEEILAKLPEICYNLYGLQVKVPIRYEITTGESLYEV